MTHRTRGAGLISGLGAMVLAREEILKKLYPYYPLVSQRPDRHVPALKCGYPLPCPYHTVMIRLKRKGTR